MVAACGGGGDAGPVPSAASATIASTTTPATSVAPPAATQVPASLPRTPVVLADPALPLLPALPAYEAAGTTSYAIRASRRDADLYELAGGLGFVETHRCPELGTDEAATLAMAGYRGVLRFSASRTECPVVGFFARSAVLAGTYGTTAGYRRAEWYALADAKLIDSYRARTVNCTDAPEAQAAHLSVSATQAGRFDLLAAGGSTPCELQQLYVMTPLP
jgi:hypothetical protein